MESIQEIKNKIPTPVFKYLGVQHYRDEFDKNQLKGLILFIKKNLEQLKPLMGK